MKSRYCAVSCLLTPLVTVVLAGPAQAATDMKEPASSEWSVGLGLGAAWSAEYRGADSYETKGVPWFQARKGRFSINPVTGLSYDLLKTQNWTLASSLSYAAGRDNAGALARFEDVHGSVMAGAIVSWSSGHWQVNGDVAAPVSGDLEGVRVRAYLRYRGQISERLSYGFGPGASWGSSNWNQALFDVSTSDAARSGLNTYRTEGDFVRASMNGRLTYQLTPLLSVSTIARYSRLLADAADSPIVADVGNANQWLGSVILNYQF